MDYHAVMDDMVPQTPLGQTQAEIHVLAAVKENLVETPDFQEEVAATGATGCGDGAPFANLALEGSMEEALAIVASITLWGEDHAHVVVTAVTGELLHVADHACVQTLPQNGEHGLQPVALDEDVVIEEAEKFASRLASNLIVVNGKVFTFLVEEDAVRFGERAKVINGAVLTGVVHDENLV
tara:strand:- start:50 stop:595 length:546 start_codon:yes stop_codon:yes gene_type:complete